MSQHRNKLNREKRGRNRLLYVATKISTQCKEVLPRHNKLGRDRMSKMNTEESYRDMKTRLRQQILTTPRIHVTTSEHNCNKKSSSVATSLYRDRLFDRNADNTKQLL